MNTYADTSCYISWLIQAGYVDNITIFSNPWPGASSYVIVDGEDKKISLCFILIIS